MSDLIDRDSACKTLMDDCHIKIMSGNNWIRLEEAVARLTDLPTIEERKTGKWIIDDDWNMCDIEGTLVGTKEFECDKCGYRELVFDGTVTHLNYCPNCGADMRGDT